MINKILKSFLLFLPFFIVSCSGEKEINEDTFAQVYANLVIAQDTLLNRKEEFIKIQQEIFNKYNTSEEEYISAIKYYNSEPERWEIFFNKAIMYVEELRKKKNG